MTVQVLTACSLASFSLADCTQSLLGRRLEVLSPQTLAALAGLSSNSPLQAFPATSRTPQARALRLAR